MKMFLSMLHGVCFFYILEDVFDSMKMFLSMLHGVCFFQVATITI